MSACISGHGEYSEHTPDAEWTCTLCGDVDTAGLRAKVRADERAKVLAAFTEERKDRRSCGCRVPVNALWSCCFSVGHTVATERRLVSPWEPTP